jgi:N-acetyl-anhydromuramyl-L-alanine amidase AmpD
MAKREIELGIIHCADTPSDMDIGSKEIDDWHRARGWSAIGYHYVIRRDGTIEKGRDLDNDGDVFDEIGAHAKGFNRNSIGICLVGGMGGFNFTSQQLRSLDKLMDIIENTFTDIEWLGHCDLPGVDKKCPQFDVRAWRGK